MSDSTDGITALFPDSQDKINVEWFQGVMKDHLPGIISVQPGSTTTVDEGALGLLLPFDVRVTDSNTESGEKVCHFIVKIKADLSEMYNDIKPLLFHPRESFAYKYLLPLFADAVKAVVPSDAQSKLNSFYTKSYLAEYDIMNSRGIVVMEDLKKDGYDLVDFTQGLDLAELKAAVKALAYHHALSHSVILHKKEQVNSGEYKKFLNWVSETSLLSVWGTFLAEGLRWFANSHPEKIELEAKLNQLAARSAEILGRYTNYDQGGVPVICHGDYWCNNIMFKQASNGDEPVLKLVDFQCVGYGTPGKDLATLLLSSLTPELRRSCTDDILVLYHKSFQEACALLELPKGSLTLGNLQKDFQSSLLNGVLWCFVSFQMFLVSEETEERLFWILKDMADQDVF